MYVVYIYSIIFFININSYTDPGLRRIGYMKSIADPYFNGINGSGSGSEFESQKNAQIRIKVPDMDRIRA